MTTILTESIINAKADWLKAVEYCRECSRAVPKGDDWLKRTPKYLNALHAYWASIQQEKQALSKYRSVMAKERFRKDK